MIKEMSPLEKTETLKDGMIIKLRGLQLEDLDKLMKFYRSLPLADRKYLKFDVTNRKAVAKRLRRMETGDDIRVAALYKNEIIASGALELSGEQWSKHQGEIRVIIAHAFQHKGLGTILIRELYFIAIQKKIETIVARMMRPQVAAAHIFRKLGFHEEVLLPDHVRDIEGTSQDLIIMACNVKDLMKELDHLFRESDWQRCR
jgi:L-amino acid N-acyltransferase YncA